jgi:hypothetical protein
VTHTLLDHTGNIARDGAVKKTQVGFAPAHGMRDLVTETNLLPDMRTHSTTKPSKRFSLVGMSRSIPRHRHA